MRASEDAEEMVDPGSPAKPRGTGWIRGEDENVHTGPPRFSARAGRQGTEEVARTRPAAAPGSELDQHDGRDQAQQDQLDGRRDPRRQLADQERDGENPEQRDHAIERSKPLATAMTPMRGPCRRFGARRV